METHKQDLKSEKRFAKFISSLSQPPLISIPTFAVINYYLMGGLYSSIGITFICFIFAAFLPVITSLIIINKMKIDIDITDRSKRTLPLSFAVFSYIIGFFVLYFLGAPAITTALMFIYFTNTLLTIFINFSWKISIHAIGIAGPTAALIYTFGIPGVIFGLMIPLVMWSRVKLKKHTVSQVMAGAVLGLIVTTVQLYYIVPLV
jgi:membrane-associated phospholipid phosphatase